MSFPGFPDPFKGSQWFSKDKKWQKLCPFFSCKLIATSKRRLESLKMTCTEPPDCPLARHYFVFVKAPLEGTKKNYFPSPYIFENMFIFNDFFFLRLIMTSKSGLESLKLTCRDTSDCPLSRHHFVFVITQLEGTLINYFLRPLIFKNMSDFQKFEFVC